MSGGVVKVINNLPKFEMSMKDYLSQGLGQIAADILVTARGKTPFDKGALRRESDTFKKSQLQWQVRYHMEYALAQEAGKARRGKKTVYFRNYSTPNTGSGYLKKSGDEVFNKSIQILKIQAQRAKV